jgi:hypothetical protein
MLPYDPNRLLDTLTVWLGIDSDKTLASMLQISPQIIRGIRNGRLPVRPSILIPMAECVGKSIDELRRILGDRRKKARMSLRMRAG